MSRRSPPRRWTRHSWPRMRGERRNGWCRCRPARRLNLDDRLRTHIGPGVPRRSVLACPRGAQSTSPDSATSAAIRPLLLSRRPSRHPTRTSTLRTGLTSGADKRKEALTGYRGLIRAHSCCVNRRTRQSRRCGRVQSRTARCCGAHPAPAANLRAETIDRCRPDPVVRLDARPAPPSLRAARRSGCRPEARSR